MSNDSRLHNRARVQLVDAALDAGFEPRQCYAQKVTALNARRAGRALQAVLAHAGRIQEVESQGGLVFRDV